MLGILGPRYHLPNWEVGCWTTLGGKPEEGGNTRSVCGGDGYDDGSDESHWNGFDYTKKIVMIMVLWIGYNRTSRKVGGLFPTQTLVLPPNQEFHQEWAT